MGIENVFRGIEMELGLKYVKNMSIFKKKLKC